MTRLLFSAILFTFIFPCKPVSTQTKKEDDINVLAERYVKLALNIGQYDESFVDAYYGPDSLKPVAKALPAFPKDSLLKATEELLAAAKTIAGSNAPDSVKNRAGWISDQLVSFGRRIRIFSGEFGSFDEESKDLFGVAAPVYDEQHYKDLVNKLDHLLPGKGSIPDRFQSLANRFIIPKPKLDTVFKTAIAECRRRTKQHYQLPANESFTLEYVNNKPWNGYNWYKGNYTSLIQINTDINIFMDRAIDVGSHESYPGHHVYNMLLEKNLYHDQGLVEISMYPLFSPQSLIAEGTANYGIDVVFPGDDKTKFAKDVLLPLAGLDTAGISLYIKAMSIKGELNYARNEAARGIVNKTMSEEEALRWLKDYALFNDETAAKSIKFINANRSYVINYNYGQDLVRGYVESRIKADPSPENRWKVFGELMSQEVRIGDLKR
ncbi:MAG: hypothetical protein IPP15_06750 [Saprospiraceae bacterium]|uniref:DUF885 domain-containing protein n=1 Tax=Candidatus Opimibacter skivensis TaxID=2982028 RepID=A0A9D7SS56_9BACT|nr:hypothetical protein [Candidatus Opimibacter skivensis]